MPFAQWKSLPPEMPSLWDTAFQTPSVFPDTSTNWGVKRLQMWVSPATPTDEVSVEDIPPDPADESGTNLRFTNGSVASSDHGEKSLVIDPSRLADHLYWHCPYEVCLDVNGMGEWGVYGSPSLLLSTLAANDLATIEEVLVSMPLRSSSINSLRWKTQHILQRFVPSRTTGWTL
jgi:hypothetical protein